MFGEQLWLQGCGWQLGVCGGGRGSEGMLERLASEAGSLAFGAWELSVSSQQPGVSHWPGAGKKRWCSSAWSQKDLGASPAVASAGCVPLGKSLCLSVSQASCRQ